MEIVKCFSVAVHDWEVLGSIPATPKTFPKRTCQSKIVVDALRKRTKMEGEWKIILTALPRSKTALKSTVQGKDIKRLRIFVHLVRKWLSDVTASALLQRAAATAAAAEVEWSEKVEIKMINLINNIKVYTILEFQYLWNYTLKNI